MSLPLIVYVGDFCYYKLKEGAAQIDEFLYLTRLTRCPRLERILPAAAWYFHLLYAVFLRSARKNRILTEIKYRYLHVLALSQVRRQA